MRRTILALFAALVLSQAADAQLFRRFRPAPVEQAPMPTEVKKAAPKAADVQVTVQADAGRGGRIRDLIKRLLGR